MPKLQTLKTLDEDPATVKAACFYCGWQLLTLDNWTYRSVWTGERGEVSLDKLIEAVEAKKLLLSPKHREKSK